MFALFLTYSIGSLLLAALGIPLALRLVRPNPYYGFRIKVTLEDSELWYPVNQYFGQLQFFVGISTFLCSYLLYRLPNITIDAYALDVLGIFLLFCIPAIFIASLHLNRLKKKL